MLGFSVELERDSLRKHLDELLPLQKSADSDTCHPMGVVRLDTDNSGYETSIINSHNSRPENHMGIFILHHGSIESTQMYRVDL